MLPSQLFAVRYVSADALPAFLALNEASILGVIGYGAGRPAALAASCPFAAAPIAPAIGGALFEIWSANGPVRRRRVGIVTGSHTDAISFALVELEEREDRPFEAIIERAYRGIFDFLDGLSCGTPIRFWNYLPGITEEEDGLERYRRFNVGRHDAFSDRLKLPVPPVASALGGRIGAPLIYFLAGIDPAETIENPRQVSAFAYPPLYGPRSPRFSRAAIHENGGARSLFISGTASIVGHVSQHPGDLRAQLGETLENIRLLIGEAERRGLTPGKPGWAFKVYLRHADDRDIVQPVLEHLFGDECTYLYLRADICRPELLVEIEALNIPEANRPDQ
jgi:chorismate lyase/3-hydroxybenzoate synthase